MCIRDRFCTLLHEMTAATETRFIIITHNPITMALSLIHISAVANPDRGYTRAAD